MKVNFDCCQNCDKRKAGCHSSCEEYIATRKKNDDERNKTYLNKQKEMFYLDYITDFHRKAKKKKGKK